MQDAFLPVFLFVLCMIGLAVGLLLVARVFNPGRPGRVMRMPYESGMDPIHDTHRRFDVRFHLLAIAFLVFDVELLFLYPWAVAMGGGVQGSEFRVQDSGGSMSIVASAVSESSSSESPIPNPSNHHSSSPAPISGIDAAVADHWVESRHLVFGGAMTFIVLLTLGFVYDWRKGVFQWR